MLPMASASGRATLIGVVAGALGGLLPDLDHPDSLLGRWLPWPAVREAPYTPGPIPTVWHRVGRWRPGGVIWHRGELHSVGAAALAATVATAAIWLLPPSWLPRDLVWLVFVAVFVGYTSHLLLDLFTPSPQMLFWPLSRRLWRPRWLPALRGGGLFVGSCVGCALELWLFFNVMGFLFWAGLRLLAELGLIGPGR